MTIPSEAAIRLMGVGLLVAVVAAMIGWYLRVEWLLSKADRHARIAASVGLGKGWPPLVRPLPPPPSAPPPPPDYVDWIAAAVKEVGDETMRTGEMSDSRMRAIIRSHCPFKWNVGYIPANEL